MNISLKIFLFIVLIIQLMLIINTLKLRKMSMRYGSLWMFILILMAIAIIFPNIFTKMSMFFGFETTSNMIFLIGFFFLFYIIFVLTMSLSKQQSTIKALIQEISILKSKLNNDNNKNIKGERYD